MHRIHPQNKHMLRDNIHDHLQHVFLLLYFFLGSLVFVDVGAYAIPASQFTMFIAARHRPVKKPSIGTVGTSDSQSILEWFSAGPVGAPFLDMMWKVFRMDDLLPLCPEHLFQSQPGVGEQGLVHEVARTVRQCRPNHGWDRIYSFAKVTLSDASQQTCGIAVAHSIDLLR